MYRSLLLLALGLAAPAALAQPGGPPGGSVAGLVLDDATSEPIPSATVALYQAPDTTFITGTITTPDGRFSIERMRPGDYTVRVSFVGYATQSLPAAVRPGAPTDLGTIRLAESAVELGEVEATAQRELVEQRADRTVYNVSDQPVTAGGSAIETLQTLPSLEVDASGNISLRGNQNVAVQINGRPVPVTGAFLTALLRQIPASNIARVEVIPNPSARYDPEGMSGIVNIVLKENTDRGLSGGLTLGGGTAPSAEAGGNVSYQRGPIDFTVNYGFRYDEFGLLGTSDRAFLAGALEGTAISDSTTDDNGTTSHYGSGTFDYTLAPGQNLTLQGSLGVRNGTSDNAVYYLTTPASGAATESERLTEGDRDGTNSDVSLTYRRRFDGQQGGGGAPSGGGRGMMGGPGRFFGGPSGGAGTTSAHELALEGRFTRNDDDRLDRYTTTGDPDERATTDETNDEAYLQLDYSRPLGALQLETGAKATWRAVDSDLLYETQQGGQFVTDAGRTNAFDYDEDIYAAYLQGSRGLGPLQVQVGLRAEVAARDFTLLTPLPDRPGLPAVDPDATRLTYASLFPSAFVTYPLGEGTLVKASYSRRINRPRTFFLNPFPSFEDTLSVNVGNPLLRPEYTDAYELTFQYRYFLTVTPFYRHTTDVLRRRVLFDPDTGVSTFTFQNLDTQDSYGADLTLTAALGPVRGFLSGSVFRSVTDGGSVETGVASDALTWTLRGNLQLKVREGTDLQFFAFYRGPQDVEDGHVSGFGFSTLALNQKFSDHLSLALRVNDPLSTTRFAFRTGGETFALTGVRDPDITQFSGTLTYTFGRAPQRRPQQPNPQPQDDTGMGF